MAIYLIASGLSLVFGVLGVLNFAHGSLYMYGAFLVFTFTRHLLHTVPGNFWLAILIVPVLVALMGSWSKWVFCALSIKPIRSISSSSPTAWCSCSVTW